ncbi:hypothetical protein Tco_1211528 [Tanacetum coccineum]
MTLASSAKKPSKTFDELISTLIDFFAFIMNGLKINNLTQETLLGLAFRLLNGTRSNYAELEYDFEECYTALLEKPDWENPKGGDYPFDLTKPLPLVMSRNHQKVPVDYFFNNDLKYLQGGISTMTYTTSLTKTKADQYDLPDIEEMVPNIWVPVKVEVMRKHGYGYLKEIVVRRADNDLYRFNKGDFPHLRINDIEDMLLLVVQNWLTNLLGNDVSDFAIALRMFTRSLVIQKRVEDLHLGVESYQRKINVTRPETTKCGIRKRDPYTPYQDPQGFIYVDNNRINRLMRSDELYKFSDRTLTGLRTSLDDITKNIRMEYLPKRRWSTLEKKRANIMIKAIDKQLKERRMKRSLKRFVGGRDYRTDLRFNTTAGNPVKDILLKLNLPDHRSILTDSKEYIKMDMEVIDCFKEALDRDKDPMERSFDDYKWVFDLEIEQLADEYEFGIRKKGHILDMIWENCKNIQGKSKEWWYDYWLEEDEKQENGDKKYDPPMVHMETFKITRYLFNNRNSFICVIDEIKDTLSLGRENESRFRKMIRHEINQGEDTHDKM